MQPQQPIHQQQRTAFHLEQCGGNAPVEGAVEQCVGQEHLAERDAAAGQVTDLDAPGQKAASISIESLPRAWPAAISW